MAVKTTPPSLSGVLRRKALYEAFGKLPPGHALWCVAPAGSGKTLGAAGFIQETGAPCLWLSLDEADADPATLFRYLAEAASGLQQPPLNLPTFALDRIAGLPAFARLFFRALYSIDHEDWWFVLDNHHFLPEASPAHTVLRIAMEELPEAGRILVTSRCDPPPEYAALRLNERLRVLPPGALLLSPQESMALARLCHPELPEELGREAHRLAHGWAAGVVLTLRHMASGGTTEAGVPTESGQLVFDYLFSEVWRDLAPAVQTFLVRIACLPHLSEAVARDVGGLPEAGEILEDFVRRQQFVIRAQASEPCYELHALFKAFLNEQGRRSLTPAQRNDLFLEAAAWYRACGRQEDAAALLRRAEAWDDLGILVLHHAPVLLAEGRAGTLLQWIGVLPEPARQAPWIGYWQAMARLFLDPERSLPEFAEVADRFRETGEKDGEALAVAGVMDAILFGMLGARALDPWLPRLEELLEARPAFRSPEAGARVLATFFRSLMMRKPEHPRIREYAAALLREVATAGDLNLRVLAEVDVAFHHMFRGDLDGAFALLEQVDARCRAGGVAPMGQVTLRRAQAWYALLTLDQALGRKVIGEGLALGREHGVPVWDTQFHSTALALALCAGNSAGTRHHLEALEALPDPAKKVNQAYNHCTFAWHALEQREPERAARHLAIARQGADEHGVPFLEAQGELVAAQVQAALGEPELAERAVERAEEIAEAMDSDLLRFSCRLRRAVLAHQGGTDPFPQLREALFLGRRRGFAFCYWWRREEMASLAALALEADIEPDYVRRLIRAGDLPALGSLAPGTPWPWRVEIQVLGHFEVRIDGQPLKFSGKAQRRPLELLMALVAHGGRQVPESVLADCLWPDAEGDHAHRSFVTTLQRLRKLLGAREFLVLSDGRLSLEAGRISVDLWRLEEAAAELQCCLRKDDLTAAEKWFERLVAFYQGPLLANEPDIAWATAPRLRTRARFQQVVAELGNAFLKRGLPERAARCLHRGLDVEPGAELLCQGAIAAYRRLGDEASVRALQQRCPRLMARHPETARGAESAPRLPKDACCEPS
ncbi:MAG TPA: hypothetical protein ENJ79_04270 [Gammaproteobacteria bacterium]|nr:hypothetical protein [Gammaproteobacteria bacterium]